MTKVAERGDQPVAESNTVHLWERLARDPQVDVAKLEKLMELKERADARNAAAEFWSAFSNMQAEIPIITEKGEIKVGGEVRSKYATFEDINEVVKPILQKHGFAISFRTEFGDNKVTIIGVLAHRSGHKEQTSFISPADTSGSKNAIQALGSTVSYGCRYTLKALLNISTRGADDDGKGAAPLQLISNEQAALIEDLLRDSGADRAAFLRYFQVARVEDLTARVFPDARNALAGKLKQKERGGK